MNIKQKKDDFAIKKIENNKNDYRYDNYKTYDDKDIGFSSDIVNVEEEEVDDEYSNYDNNNQESPTYDRFKKDRFNSEMDKISEAEVEDDKYTTVFERVNEELMRDEFRLTEHNIDELLKTDINKKNIKQYFNPTLYQKREDFKFKPEINENSKQIVARKTQSDLSRSKSPVELELYNDAMKRKEKLQKLEYNNMMEILLKASKSKLSNNSHKIALKKVEKMIEDAVNNNSKSNRVNFIEIGEILSDLKIFREIFRNNLNESNISKKYSSYKDIKHDIKNMKEIEKRKKSEIDFYEQIWMILNPNNKEYIKTEIISEFLKILFSPAASSVKDISSILKQFLSAAFFLNSDIGESINKTFTSPITEKNISNDEVWTLDKLVREFLNLKENILAYQGIKNFSKKLNEDIDKFHKTVANFQPNSNLKEYNSRSTFFQDRIQVLFDREKLRKEVLAEMKRENEESELRNCTFRPKTNKRNGYEESDENVYEKLYSKYKDKQDKIKRKQEEQEKIKEKDEISECTFKPEKFSTDPINKSNLDSNTIYSERQRKGYEDYIRRARNGTRETFRKKYLKNKIPVGENYERVKNADIKPFNITDMKKKKQQNEKYDEDYFSIQIAIPNGRERTLRVHKDDDPYEIAEEFCLIYGLKDEIKERLAKTILNFMSIYLSKNTKIEKTDDDTNQKEFSHHNLNLDDL